MNEPLARSRIAVHQGTLHADDIAVLTETLQSSHGGAGSIVAQFEREFAAAVGTRFAVAVSSGTTALCLALIAHGIGPDDEVITSTFAPMAAANAIRRIGARPRFVDIRDDTFTIDSTLIQERISGRTRAVLPVHVFGAPADMEEILRIAASCDLQVIEDATQAQSAAIADRQVGSFGTGCFDLNGDSLGPTVGGGIITTDSPALDDRLRLLRSDGARSDTDQEAPGHECCLSDVQAAIGLMRIRGLHAKVVTRQEHAAYLTARLPCIETPTTLPAYRHVFHEYVIRIPHGRDVVARRLAEVGIDTAILRSQPLHRQPRFRDQRRQVPMPVAERASRELLSLPIHAALTCGDLDLIAERVASVVARLAPQRSLQFTRRQQRVAPPAAR